MAILYIAVKENLIRENMILGGKLNMEKKMIPAKGKSRKGIKRLWLYD